MSGRRTRNGSTRRWRRLRAAVLERDGYLCQRPLEDGAPCLAPATDAGHIVDWALGGTDDPENLRGECETHNSRAGGELRQMLANPTRKDYPA